MLEFLFEIMRCLAPLKKRKRVPRNTKAFFTTRSERLKFLVWALAKVVLVLSNLLPIFHERGGLYGKMRGVFVKIQTIATISLLILFLITPAVSFAKHAHGVSAGLPQPSERFRDSHFTDRITYRQSVKLIRNLEFRASSAQLYVYVWRTPW